jgi:hypothetical protein
LIAVAGSAKCTNLAGSPTYRPNCTADARTWRRPDP